MEMEDRCPCCGHVFGCYCHEHPHSENAKCPGNVPTWRRPTAIEIGAMIALALLTIAGFAGLLK